MASGLKARRGASPKTVAIVVILMVAPIATGFSVYRAIFGGRSKPTGIAAQNSLPAGQFAPPERMEPGGQGGPPHGDSP